MKKYLILGAVVVLIGALGSRVWYARSADDCGEFRGLTGRHIRSEQLENWPRNNDDVISEIDQGQFYIQEEIGSQGASIAYPQKLNGDFIISFDLKSITKSAEINLITADSGQSRQYRFEVKQLGSKQVTKIWNDGKLLGQYQGKILYPDVYYHFIIERRGAKAVLEINGKEILAIHDDELHLAETFELSISGQPDHPAAVMIKNMKIYQ